MFMEQTLTLGKKAKMVRSPFSDISRLNPT